MQPLLENLATVAWLAWRPQLGPHTPAAGATQAASAAAQDRPRDARDRDDRAVAAGGCRKAPSVLPGRGPADSHFHAKAAGG